jgi:O-acetyl-ADP-ribose deacetylase (regulator of RNase III)
MEYHREIQELVTELKDLVPEGVFRQIQRDSRGHDRLQLKNLLTVINEPIGKLITDRINRLLLLELDTVSLTNAEDITAVVTVGSTDICIWRGDITKLQVGAIVNAANSALLGCFRINHLCIDNAIHCASGPELRMVCREYMSRRGAEFGVGEALLTPAFCLPCDAVVHTVGPCASYEGQEQPMELAQCYRSCLNEVSREGISSIAFCCISTGVFGYPAVPAALVAMETVKEWIISSQKMGEIGGRVDSGNPPDTTSLEEPSTSTTTTNSSRRTNNKRARISRIIFNVFTENDQTIYTKYITKIFQ